MKKKKEITLKSYLTLKEVPWLEGRISLHVGSRTVRVFDARLNMRHGRLVLTQKRKGQVADITGKPPESSDTFTKWAYETMMSIGSRAVELYLKMDVGGSISSDEILEKLPDFCS